MQRVTIYTQLGCTYSRRAKLLLDGKGVPYDEVPIDGDPAKREEMRRLSGRTSTPQIFIGGRHVGGSDELQALEDRGELDPLLGVEEQPQA